MRIVRHIVGRQFGRNFLFSRSIFRYRYYKISFPRSPQGNEQISATGTAGPYHNYFLKNRRSL